MSREQFQVAFDFFGEPEKPADAPSGQEAAPAGSEATGGVHLPQPEKSDEAAAPSGESAPLTDFDLYLPGPAVSEESVEFLSGSSIPVSPEKPKSRRGRKSQKAMAEEVERVQVPEDEELFKKQYYGIREVSEMFGVNGSLLRYWESEFGLKLRKNRKGDRFFTPHDIKTVQLIHDLLRRRKFTIDGARDFLKKSKGADERYEMIQSLQRVRKFLLELTAHL